MHGNTEKTACDFLFPRVRELDGRDFGQNINAQDGPNCERSARYAAMASRNGAYPPVSPPASSEEETDARAAKYITLESVPAASLFAVAAPVS
jgi:hypothetical protein